MELSKEFINEHELTETAVKAINGLNANTIAELKKGWDGKANSDAQAILEGAMKPVTDLTGYVRPDGEKIGDFFNNAWTHHSTSKSSELAALKSEYEDKMKSAGGNEMLTKEYEALKDRVENHYKKIEVDYTDVLPFKEKYEAQSVELKNFKLDLAFNSNKPNFPDTVNEYEAQAKWGEFKADVLNKYDIEFDNGQAIAVDKENKHRVVKLKDLISEQKTLNELLVGRQQSGVDARSIKTENVDGVPFKVPVGATGKEIGELVQTHLTTQGLSVMSTEYSNKYKELYSKIKNRQQTAA